MSEPALVEELTRPPRRFRRYSDYKDARALWLQSIPIDWSEKPLKALLSRNDSGAWGDDALQGGMVVLRSTEQTVDGKWKIEAPAERNLTARDATRTRLEVGDLVVTKSSGSHLHIGKTSIVDEAVASLAAGFSNFMQRLRLTERHEPRYFWYLLNSPIAREQVVFMSSTTTGLGNLNGSILGAISVPVPLHGEQRAIVAFLDRETTRIDALVAKKERLIELLQEKRSALVTRAVTKGLDPSVPMKDSGVEWLGEIPSKWEVMRLKRVAFIRYGLGEPPRKLATGLPFIRATDVSRGRILDQDIQFVDPADVPWNKKPRLNEGDIIVVRSGAYTGDSAIVPLEFDGAIAGYDMVVRPKEYAPAFLAWAMLSRYVLEAQMKIASLRAAQPHLNAEELGAVLILLPPESEQHAISGHLDRRTAKIDTLIAKIRTAIDHLHELRTALISAAVTGKIDVREEVA